MDNKKIRQIVIFGDGVEAQLAALVIKSQFDEESFAVSIVSGGSQNSSYALSLQPESISIFNLIGLDEKTLMRNVKSNFKFGTLFENLDGKGKSCFQPFGTHGGPMDLVSFQHFAIKKRIEQGSFDYNDYSLAAKAALANKFVHPQNPGSLLSTLSYSLHLSAEDLEALFAHRCRALGVNVIQGAVKEVNTSNDRITNVVLDDLTQVNGDFFIDCTNQIANPFAEAMEIKIKSWSEWFENDRVARVFSSNEGEELFTRVKADSNKIVRQIGLADGSAQDVYYSSRVTSAEEVARELKSDSLAKDVVDEQFIIGTREVAWKGNYLALGRAFGQYEPLNASNFHGFIVGLQKFIALFPRTDDCELESFELNRKLNLWYENMRDINLLYHLSLEQKAGNSSNNLSAINLEKYPQSFQHKFKTFIDSGQLAYYEEEAFSEPFRSSLYLNLQFWPSAYDPRMDRFDMSQMNTRFDEMKSAINSTVAQMPNHLQYRSQYLDS
ncbi:MAG: tryptophan 7-halogenase [Kangiellaceae bacterium]|nr:tryptophan 7-halogenase [Kangiellaceae bacterium]MCW8998564.1 tryptophan 7-halogenase [Kangiellaceae bacterium]MCW9018426.1 tryptophan 7-halogenase [Kangiellaceae bacterium]